MPIIHYTRSNFFVKGGEVTTPTIMGSLFSPRDVMNTLIELNNQLPGFPHAPAHLALASLTQSGSLQCSAAHPLLNSEIPWSCRTRTQTFLFGQEVTLLSLDS